MQGQYYLADLIGTYIKTQISALASTYHINSQEIVADMNPDNWEFPEASNLLKIKIASLNLGNYENLYRNELVLQCAICCMVGQYRHQTIKFCTEIVDRLIRDVRAAKGNILLAYNQYDVQILNVGSTGTYNKTIGERNINYVYQPFELRVYEMEGA